MHIQHNIITSFYKLSDKCKHSVTLSLWEFVLLCIPRRRYRERLHINPTFSQLLRMRHSPYSDLHPNNLIFTRITFHKKLCLPKFLCCTFCDLWWYGLHTRTSNSILWVQLMKYAKVYPMWKTYNLSGTSLWAICVFLQCSHSTTVHIHPKWVGCILQVTLKIDWRFNCSTHFVPIARTKLIPPMTNMTPRPTMVEAEIHTMTIGAKANL